MLLPFKKGAFHLAVAAQLPIVPIVCENYSAAYSSKHKRFDGGELTIRGAPRWPVVPHEIVLTVCQCTVLPPISTTGITSSSEDVNALVDKTRNAMLEAIEDLGRRRAEINRLKGVFKDGESSSVRSGSTSSTS